MYFKTKAKYQIKRQLSSIGSQRFAILTQDD